MSHAGCVALRENRTKVDSKSPDDSKTVSPTASDNVKGPYYHHKPYSDRGKYYILVCITSEYQVTHGTPLILLARLGMVYLELTVMHGGTGYCKSQDDKAQAWHITEMEQSTLGCVFSTPVTWKPTQEWNRY